MKFKNWFVKIERFLLYVNLFFASLLLLSYLSAIVSPQKCWPLAFLALGYIILLYINLFFSIYWAARFKRYFFISAVSILLGFGTLANTIGFNVHTDFPTASSTARLKLMTYNVHNFLGVDSPLMAPSQHRIFKLLDSAQPDIIGFEEFNTRYAHFRIFDSLKRVLGTTQYYFEPFTKAKYDSTGVAIFSKYPIVNHGTIGLYDDFNNIEGIYADIKYGSQIIRVYDFHLQSIFLSDEHAEYLHGIRHPEAFSFSRLKTSILKLKYAFILRAQQVDMIRRHAARCPYPYIFMGDFNDTPSSYTFKQLSAGMKNTFRQKGTGIGRTFKESFMGLQIDYILVSKQFDVLNYKAIHSGISDHYPVRSEVSLH